jgi:hypothetical protein
VEDTHRWLSLHIKVVFLKITTAPMCGINVEHIGERVAGYMTESE